MLNENATPRIGRQVGCEGFGNISTLYSSVVNSSLTERRSGIIGYNLLLLSRIEFIDRCDVTKGSLEN